MSTQQPRLAAVASAKDRTLKAKLWLQWYHHSRAKTHCLLLGNAQQQAEPAQIPSSNQAAITEKTTSTKHWKVNKQKPNHMTSKKKHKRKQRHYIATHFGGVLTRARANDSQKPVMHSMTYVPRTCKAHELVLPMPFR